MLRYGQTIGFANRTIPAGSWVREEMIDMPAPPPLDRLPLSTAVPAPLPPLPDCTFEGYRHPDGSAGTRNILGIATTVQCVAPTVEYAARRIKAELLPRFSNVDDVVAVTHSYGCGVAIDAPGAAIPIRTLKHISLHPNLAGAPLVVSLGCEKLQPARLFGSEFPILGEANVIRLQDLRGFAEMVAAIMDAAEKRLVELDRRRRRTCPAAGLVVGLQCGHLLTPRAETPQVARALIREMQWYDEYLARGQADRSANTTPGNKRGGLANIVEKALGSIATGQATIEQVGWEIFRFILDVASGRKKTWAEHWGLANALSPFNPGPVT